MSPACKGNGNGHEYLTTLLIAIVTLQLVAWTPYVCSLPQGAPETVCDTMLPFHGGGIPPSKALAPFQILANEIVGQGQTMRVDILGVLPGLQFEGFMIQARNPNNGEILGQFIYQRDGLTKLMNCYDSANNSVTHANSNSKPEIRLEWQAPPNYEGNVVFNSTVAQGYAQFWVGVQSKPVRVVKRELAPAGNGLRNSPARNFGNTRTPFSPTYAPPNVAAVMEDPILANCGISKTCFGLPDGCLATRSCTVFSAITVRGDIYEIELKSGRDKTPAYIALGLSEDALMGDDLVTECIPENGRVKVYSSYTAPLPNPGVTRSGVPQNSARLLESSIVDGVIYCKVERKPVTIVQGRTFDLIKNKYHLMLAAGASVKENGAGYHDLGRIASGSPINLAEVQELAGSKYLLVRLHGAFMIIAWIGTTSLGIIFARYFRQTWVGSQTCGKDQWFAWHRICMVMTWCLSLSGAALIFIELGAWSAERNPHAVLGVITNTICFLQPIGALFRPAPSSKSRPIFNWIHWLGGNVAHILAIVTIFFSVKLTKAQLPEWMDWILVAYVVVHVLVHLIFSVAGCASDRHQTERLNTFQMGDIGHHHGRNGMNMERKLDAPYSAFRKGLLAAYTVVLVLFVLVLVAIVVFVPIDGLFKS